MKVVKISKPGDADVLSLDSVDSPAIGDHDIFIKVEAAGVNRPDIMQRKGLYPPPPDASPIPGLEVSGIVSATGANVTRFKEGDAVCALVNGGGYAEYCIAPEGQVLPRPQNLSAIEAAALPETFFTTWSNVFDRAFADEGDTLLVHGGTSGIGTTAIALAKAFGLTVITTVGSDLKADWARYLGADHVINYRTQDFVKEVQMKTKGKGVNIVLDMVGGDYIPRNIDCLATGGRHVSIAFLNGPKAEINFAPIMMKRILLTGSTLRARSRDFKAAIASQLHQYVWPLIENGQVSPVIDSVFPLSDASAAHKRMESSKHIGKIVLSV